MTDPNSRTVSEPMRMWPFATAPEKFRFYDNGGDEDWVVHVPSSCISQPVPRCPDHPDGRDSWDCLTCEDVRYEDPVLTTLFANWDFLAVCGRRWYILDDGSHVCITHHA